MKDKKNLLFIIIGIIMVAVLTFLDQITKIMAVNKLSDGPFVLIEGVFEFRYINNYGAAWGILTGQRAFFVIMTIVVMLLISFVYYRTPKNKKYSGIIICEILLFAGALGNFIDRVMLGYVRDFLYFSLIDFPIFNIADCYVVVSAILLCILVLFVYKDEDLAFISLRKSKKSGE